MSPFLIYLEKTVFCFDFLSKSKDTAQELLARNLWFTKEIKGKQVFLKIFQDKTRMETYHKLKIFISNNITLNFTLKEISTPLSVLRVPELKTYQKASRETTYEC